MARNPGKPQSNVELLQSTLHKGSLKKSYPITIVTPMFGGGITAGKNDLTKLVRESSIRGQLRFWWRATRGAECTSVYELRKRETAIFGDTSQPSKVKIRVIPRVQKSLTNSRVEFPRYVIYSKEAGADKANAIRDTLGYTFDLQVVYEDKNEIIEIEAAIWAWINFGGIGSRTRRGCGSLYSSLFSPPSNITAVLPFGKWLRKNAQEKYRFRLTDQVKEWPTLNTIRVTSYSDYILPDPRKSHGAKGSWAQVVRCYSEFRKKSTRTQGRSLWPEPDALRYITDMAEPGHRDVVPGGKADPFVSFPRAQFGMPIIFHFKQAGALEYSFGKEREPYDTMIVPKNKMRLASPIITKSIANSLYKGFGAIIVLNQPEIDSLEIQISDSKAQERLHRDRKQHFESVKRRLKNISLQRNVIYPTKSYKLNPMQGESSAIKAFLASKEANGFCEV